MLPFLVSLRIPSTGFKWVFLPSPISATNNGIPITNDINTYTIKNAPPPLTPTIYGNLHTAPSPIANPIADIINPNLIPQDSLDFSIVHTPI